MDLLAKILPLILLPVNLFVAWVCWSMRQVARSEIDAKVSAARAELEAAGKAMAENISDIDGRLAAAQRDVAALKEDIDALPTKADIARLEEQVKSVDGHVQNTAAGVGRLEGFFLQLGIGKAQA